MAKSNVSKVLKVRISKLEAAIKISKANAAYTRIPRCRKESLVRAAMLAKRVAKYRARLAA